MMSSVRKRSKRNSNHGIPMRNVESEIAASFRHRKEKNVQLHDEADLVNFRADNIRRFAQNQELLQNVVSKLVHTSKIKPPRVFPDSSESYAGQSADELEKIVQEANSSDILVFSNIRLMRAKSKLLAAEITAEKEHDSTKNVLSEESLFQKHACETLARLQSEHRFEGSNPDVLERMEEALAQIQRQCAEKYKKSLHSSHSRYTKTSMDATELDPKVEVSRAPAGYSARENRAEFGLSLENGAMDQMGEDMEPFRKDISKDYGDSGSLEEKEQSGFGAGENEGPSQEFGPPNQELEPQNREFQGQDREFQNENREFQGENQEFQGENQEFQGENQEFQGDNQEFGPSNQEFAEQSQEYGEFDEMIKPPEKSGSRDEGINNLDVNMDDLDQFLADPNHANNDMDDMDALMNFDQEIEGDAGHNNAESIDESFGVDFLSHMD